MKKFRVSIIETLCKEVEVEAGSHDEAERKAEELYYSEADGFVLDSSNHVNTMFNSEGSVERRINFYD